jgi:heavy metal sensor kinase
MIDVTSIRFRLTAWYSLCLCAILLIFGIGARFALRASTSAAVDHELRARLDDVREFVDEQARWSVGHLKRELDEEAGMHGGMMELWDDTGALIFSSPRIRQIQQADVRAAIDTFTSHDRQYKVRVVESMRDFNQSFERFDEILLFAAPLLLLFAAAGGYWVSGRALAPVDKLTSDAASIGFSNLSHRLEVPGANDELQRLAVTLNRMLERIESAVQRIVQFTADASHELRAPLTLVHTAAEFSLRGERTPEAMRDAMQKILRESDRMTRLVEDLLLLARADSDADVEDLAPVDLLHSTSAAVESVRTVAEAKGLRLDFTSAPGSLFVMAGEQSLTRLLLILLDNAIKYTDSGGRIAVQLAQSSDRAEVVVSDTGAGIRAEDLPRIWDRFWRADKVRSRSTGGSGLGLAIAKSIALHHGAQIEVESEPGRGSSFRVSMKRIETNMELMSLVEQDSHAGQAGSLRRVGNPPASAHNGPSQADYQSAAGYQPAPHGSPAPHGQASSHGEINKV